ncbi:MAG: hypothetical protein HSCHL_0497 [Hydrogenibacillus schlegelii]|uniref:Uncharacterized protein n=1 Tax=Hydrogenibacillus schlegelii TaxID=1484 RepID=A0A2T5GDI9_HYDSH|nr:MAG: hypothetical protein HSCHL_0497 [Hydrogenibacillus schlegelii]
MARTVASRADPKRWPDAPEEAGRPGDGVRFTEQGSKA